MNFNSLGDEGGLFIFIGKKNNKMIINKKIDFIFINFQFFSNYIWFIFI